MNNTNNKDFDNAEMLLNLSVSAESIWDVLISSGDENFLSSILRLLSDDKQVKTKK